MTLVNIKKIKANNMETTGRNALLTAAEHLRCENKSSMETWRTSSVLDWYVHVVQIKFIKSHMLLIWHLHMWLFIYLAHSLVLHLVIFIMLCLIPLWYKSTSFLQNKSSWGCFWRCFRPEGYSKQYPPDFMSLPWRGL